MVMAQKFWYKIFNASSNCNDSKTTDLMKVPKLDSRSVNVSIRDLVHTELRHNQHMQ